MPITDTSKFGVVSNKDSRRFAFELKGPRNTTRPTTGPAIVSETRQVVTDFYPFKLNPQEYSVTLPARINATQTKGGVFIDDFGLGIGVISIKGFSILANHSEHTIVALEEFKKLRDDIYLMFFENNIPGKPSENIMYFHNFTDDDHFRVIPFMFKFDRSAQKPHQYTYEIGLYIIDDASSPLPTNISEFNKEEYTFGLSTMLGA